MKPLPLHADEAGFALLAVLWVMVSVAALGLAVSLAGRETVGASHNRVSLIRAAWLAEGCVERARAVIAETPGQAGWRSLDRTVPGARLVAEAGCDVRLEASGTTIDVNTASEGVLRRFTALHGIPPARADSLVAALLDWRDADQVPRAAGAERPEYEAAGLHPPRDGPLADIRELRRVRGWMGLPELDALLGVEGGRISLDHAPLPVLAALPGFTAEAVARVAERRLRDAPIQDLASLAGELSAAARDSLLAHYPELVAATTTEPDAWLVIGRAGAGSPVVHVAVELRLVRAGGRAAVVRRRSWIR